MAGLIGDCASDARPARRPVVCFLSRYTHTRDSLSIAIAMGGLRGDCASDADIRPARRPVACLVSQTQLTRWLLRPDCTRYTHTRYSLSIAIAMGGLRGDCASDARPARRPVACLASQLSAAYILSSSLALYAYSLLDIYRHRYGDGGAPGRLRVGRPPRTTTGGVLGVSAVSCVYIIIISRTILILATRYLSPSLWEGSGATARRTRTSAPHDDRWRAWCLRLS